MSVLWITSGTGDGSRRASERDYVPRNEAEAAIARLVRTVGRRWERKDVNLILSPYAHDLVQRSWHEPERMIDRAGIRAEAVGTFADR
jgi:hypothetical protein